MLKQLSIQNYAIIDAIDIRFPEGMNVVTGETGAGKSIIMGALGLILGDRADSSVLVNKEKKCIVEGVFKTETKAGVKKFLKDNELDAEEELVLRREIGTNGKSRAFINDTPVNLEQLRELSSLLVDLHQQFDALQLGENDFQDRQQHPVVPIVQIAIFVAVRAVGDERMNKPVIDWIKLSIDSQQGFHFPLIQNTLSIKYF